MHNNKIPFIVIPLSTQNMLLEIQLCLIFPVFPV